MNPLAAVVAAGLLLLLWRPASALEPSQRWDGLIRLVAAEQGISGALLKAIVEVESSYNPDATREESGGRVSVGLGQILWPDTARGLGYSGSADGLKDPLLNLRLAARLLRELLDRHGTVPLAISYYNCGRCNIDRAYVRKVYALYEKFWEGF